MNLSTLLLSRHAPCPAWLPALWWLGVMHTDSACAASQTPAHQYLIASFTFQHKILDYMTIASVPVFHYGQHKGSRRSFSVLNPF